MSSSLQPTDPSELGFDPARLRRIDTFIKDRYLDNSRYPGFTLLVSRRGQVAHLSFQGYARESEQIPMAEDTMVPDLLDEQTDHVDGAAQPV